MYLIPRLDCLGLIEARWYRNNVAVGKLIPRLDCLGLIEAAEIVTGILRATTDSEA